MITIGVTRANSTRDWPVDERREGVRALKCMDDHKGPGTFDPEGRR